MKNKTKFTTIALRTAILVTAFFACGCLQPMAASTTTSTSAPTSNGAATMATSASASASKPAYSKDSDNLVATLMIYVCSFKDMSPNSPTGPMIYGIIGALQRAGRSEYIKDDVPPASAPASALAGSIQLKDDEYRYIYSNTSRILDLCKNILQDWAKFGCDPIYKASIEIVEVITKECPVALARMDAADFIVKHALEGDVEISSLQKARNIMESAFKYVLSQPCVGDMHDIGTKSVYYVAMNKYINSLCVLAALSMNPPDKAALMKYFQDMEKTIKESRELNAKSVQSQKAYDLILADLKTVASQTDEMFQQLVDMMQIKSVLQAFVDKAQSGDIVGIDKYMTKTSAGAFAKSGMSPRVWLFGEKGKDAVQIVDVGGPYVTGGQERVKVKYKIMTGLSESYVILVSRVDGKWLLGEKDNAGGSR